MKNPLRTERWRKSCGTLRTFVGLSPTLDSISIIIFHVECKKCDGSSPRSFRIHARLQRRQASLQYRCDAAYGLVSGVIVHSGALGSGEPS